MPEMTSYEPGTPSWVDLGTPDVDGAASFYGSLFGWSVPEAENAEETGGYRLAMQDGRPVAGVMPLMAEGQPPAWSTYVSVEDADATAAAVRESGGTVVVEPTDVLQLGRMAFFADPGGAVLGVWQAKEFPGAGLTNEPVSVVWNELNTRDPEGARDFYGAALGWSSEDTEPVEGMTYTEWHRGDGALVAGMLDIRGRLPDEVPAHWLVYFAVADCDATVGRAKELGGTVAMEPMDLPVGRFAVLVDPFGAHFAVISMAEAG
ncbi:MAG: VOC family protein [Solirubrobacterales bacterium]